MVGDRKINFKGVGSIYVSNFSSLTISFAELAFHMVNRFFLILYRKKDRPIDLE